MTAARGAPQVLPWTRPERNSGLSPSFRVVDGVVRPVYLYCVDISEFVVGKLRDRGSLAVKSFVGNVQDFLVHVDRGTRG